MFPEITRDEVFRIETPRLWLRWPIAADADPLAAAMTETCRDGGARVADVNVGAVHGMIAAWRRDMTAGHALHLALTLKAGARETVGVIHTGLDRCCITPGHRALGDEAAAALRQMMTLLGVRAPARRTPPMAQQRIFAAPAAVAHCCLQA